MENCARELSSHDPLYSSTMFSEQHSRKMLQHLSGRSQIGLDTLHSSASNQLALIKPTIPPISHSIKTAMGGGDFWVNLYHP